MPVAAPALADPEIAAATFKEHLEALWATGRPANMGWDLTWLDDLRVVVKMPARRQTGQMDDYYILLGGEYYDAAPPTVAFVDPVSHKRASKGSRWFPTVEPPPWFGLHDAYNFPGQGARQLVCFSFAAEYYMTDHSPQETERWNQGKHTVSATLSRLREILSPPYYKQPSGA